MAENVLFDEVYDRVQILTPHEAMRECVLAVRRLRRYAATKARSYCKE